MFVFLTRTIINNFLITTTWPEPGLAFIIFFVLLDFVCWGTLNDKYVVKALCYIIYIDHTLVYFYYYPIFIIRQNKCYCCLTQILMNLLSFRSCKYPVVEIKFIYDVLDTDFSYALLITVCSFHALTTSVIL